VANGDPSRWRYLWPTFAAFFGMEMDDPKAVPLATIMADKAPVWARIVEKYGLIETDFGKLVNWIELGGLPVPDGLRHRP
jgi:hypothetical protein